MKDPVKACEQIAATIGKDGVDALAASSGNSELLPCPFCGHVPQDLRDALHPSGIRWREDRGQRHYIGLKDPRDGELCWEMNCLEHEGGCGANITADSREEVVTKWNNRVLWVIPAEST